MSLSQWAKDWHDKACADLLVEEGGYTPEAALAWCQSRPAEAYGTTDPPFHWWDPFGFLDNEGAKVYPQGEGPAADVPEWLQDAVKTNPKPQHPIPLSWMIAGALVLVVAVTQ